MIPIYLVSTNRADKGFIDPLERAIKEDPRYKLVPWLEAHVIVLLGDRTELLREAHDCILKGKIIAHLAGGERTKGSTDDLVRDAITKLSHLHYPFHTDAKKRLHSLQEDDWRICCAGNTAVDAILSEPLMTPSQIRERWPDTFPRDPQAGDLMIAMHPVTNAPAETGTMCRLVASIVKDFSGLVYFSSPNEDRGFEEIIECRRSLLSARVRQLPNLGALAFRSLMMICGNIIGNSSSLITEAPHLNVLPVLIGSRQEGRLPSHSDGSACKRILNHMFENVATMGDLIRTKE